MNTNGRQGGVLRAFAPGKLLLFGEHAAVYGHPAVGMAIDRGITVEIEPAAEWSFEPMPGVGDGAFAGLPRHLERVLAGETHTRGHVHIHSRLPLSAGFGSSAAFCAALAAAAIPAVRDEPHKTWRIAHEIERFFHGTPSGIDTGLSVLGGTQLFLFDKGPGALPTNRPLPSMRATVLMGSVPRTGSTRELVGTIRERVKNGDSLVIDRLERLGAIAEAAGDALGAGKAEAAILGKLADRAHSLIKSLDLSTGAVEAILDAARSAGATGGKISGAGGGGAFYALFSSPGDAEAGLPSMRSAALLSGVDPERLFLSIGP